MMLLQLNTLENSLILISNERNQLWLNMELKKVLAAAKACPTGVVGIVIPAAAQKAGRGKVKAEVKAEVLEEKKRKNKFI